MVVSGNMPYEYFSDESPKRMLSADGHTSTLEPFLSKYVFGTKDFSEYLGLCGGEERLAQLRDLELMHA